MVINVNYDLGKFKAWLFALVSFDCKKMMWFWFAVLFVEQLISCAIEIIITGHHFEHIGDSIAIFVVVVLYIHYQHELGKFLLKIITDGEEK